MDDDVKFLGGLALIALVMCGGRWFLGQVALSARKRFPLCEDRLEMLKNEGRKGHRFR